MQLRNMIRYTAKPAAERRKDILEKASYVMQYIHVHGLNKTALHIVCMCSIGGLVVLSES